MNRLIESFFDEEHIEYFSVLSYNDCRISNPSLEARIGFVPAVAILFLLPYYVEDGANVSTYATTEDYHIELRRLTDGLIKRLESRFPDFSYAGFGDHSPINEREAAAKGGLGVIGENRLLINERYGSYCFIGEVLTNAAPEVLKCQAPLPVSRCSGCGNCKKSCPTGSLSSDAECLSAITQKKGELAVAECELMKKTGTLWGCDQCQRVCPHNANCGISPIEFFHRNRITELTQEKIDRMSTDEFKRRAYAWRGRKTIERNLAILESANKDERC